MNKETFFKKFEILSDIPNGVEKLRELILQLAVQGRLLSQNSNDETALILLNKIKAEREQLIKEKKLKKVKILAQVNPKEMPFFIPNNWEWVRLGELGITQTGTTPKKGDNLSYGEDFPFVKPADILPNLVEYGNEGLSQEGVNKYGRFASAASILMVCIGSIGKVNVIERDCSFNQQINSLTPHNCINSYLINYFLRSDYFQSEAWARSSRTTLAILNKGKWEKIPVPLPPFEEQKRIVAKVDQLMALCDQLEARQQKKHEQRIHLNNAALDKLLTAPTPGKFAQHWQRICDNFDLLYDVPETVGQLRQAILQMAVQGKLVAQDSGDEPAAVLLEKIESEKDQLVKEKKIKRIRSLPQIDAQQIPYELPYNWEWVRLGDVGHDCGQKKPDKKFTYIDVSVINKEQGVISENVDILEPSEAPSRARKLVYEGSVIYATVRPYLLNIAIIDKHFEPEPIVSTAFAVLHPYSGILNKYLYYYLRSKPFITYVESEMIGMAYPAINDGKLYKGLVPIPPFEEQKRIVAKVDQLMALCDELEAGLVQAPTEGGRLMEAVVHQLYGDSQS